MAGFARDAGEYPKALRPAGEGKANGSQSSEAGPTKWTCTARHVVYAVALLAALYPDLVVTSLAIDLLAERTQTSLVQAAQTSLPDRLGYTTWHAAQVHDCDPAARLFCVPAAAAAFVSRLLCSSPGSPPGGCFGWLASRLSDQGFDHALNRTRAHGRGGESILILMQRMNHVGILIIALLVALAFLGLNVTTALAGLGIGGLAVALAAQKTLENLIGGISLLLDRAIQVGDFCKIGDRVGTVDDIGLRSLKLRTLDQNLLVVPNGVLAQMQFENMKARPKLLLQQTFSLRIETRVEQLRFVLDGVEKMLDEDPAIESGSSRLRVTNFAGAAFELELFAFVKTGDFREFTGIRQEIILKIAGIVEAAGTRFAAPTRLTYQSKDPGVDTDKANDIVRQVTELQAKNAFRIPGEVETAAK